MFIIFSADLILIQVIINVFVKDWRAFRGTSKIWKKKTRGNFSWTYLTIQAPLEYWSSHYLCCKTLFFSKNIFPQKKTGEQLNYLDFWTFHVEIEVFVFLRNNCEGTTLKRIIRKFGFDWMFRRKFHTNFLKGKRLLLASNSIFFCVYKLFLYHPENLRNLTWKNESSFFYWNNLENKCFSKKKFRFAL